MFVEWFRKDKYILIKTVYLLLATSWLGVLDWDFVMYLGIFIVYGHYVVCFVMDCQRERLLGFEFVMLANHDKT